MKNRKRKERKLETVNLYNYLDIGKFQIKFLGSKYNSGSLQINLLIMKYIKFCLTFKLCIL